MARSHMASVKAAETRAIPDGCDDMSRGAAEELTALRDIAEGTARTTGEVFLQSLVRCLARAVGAHYAFVAEFASTETTTRARTIAFWARDRIAENLEWTLAGTPCEEVVPGGCPPGAPTDPYVHALVHTVPPIKGSQRERTPSAPPSWAAAGNAAADD
jgi:hypothetical protein